MARSLTDKGRPISYAGMTPDYFTPEMIERDLRPKRTSLEDDLAAYYQYTDIYLVGMVILDMFVGKSFW